MCHFLRTYFPALLLPLLLLISGCTANDLKDYQFNGMPLTSASMQSDIPLGVNMNRGSVVNYNEPFSGPFDEIATIILFTSPIWIPLVVIWNNK